MISNGIFTIAAKNNESNSELYSQLGRLIGVGKRADGKYYLSDICIGDGINMWAKHKPVRSTSPTITPTSWKGTDGWCGLSIENALISNTTDVSNIASCYTSDKLNGWEYLKPRGSAVRPTEYYRIHDFNGYNHNVGSFVQGYTMPKTWAKDNGSFDVSFRINMYGEDKADYLSYKDLPLNGYYLGIALVGANKTYRCTNIATIEESGLSITVNVANIDNGEYVAYPFISSRAMTILDGGVFPAQVYTLPSCGSSAIVIIEESIVVMIQGVFSEQPNVNGMYSMNYTVTITNNSQSDRVFTNNYIQLRYKGKKFTDELDENEKQQELNLGHDITVSAGGKQTLYGFFTNIILELQRDAILWVSLNSAQILKSATPLQNLIPDIE